MHIHSKPFNGITLSSTPNLTAGTLTWSLAEKMCIFMHRLARNIQANNQQENIKETQKNTLKCNQ